MKKRDKIEQKCCVLVTKYPLNSQKFQGWNIFSITDLSIHDISYHVQANNCQLLPCNNMEKWLPFHPGFCQCYPGFMFKTGTCHVQEPS